MSEIKKEIGKILVPITIIAVGLSVCRKDVCAAGGGGAKIDQTIWDRVEKELQTTEKDRIIDDELKDGILEMCPALVIPYRLNEDKKEKGPDDQGDIIFQGLIDATIGIAKDKADTSDDISTKDLVNLGYDFNSLKKSTKEEGVGKSLKIVRNIYKVGGDLISLVFNGEKAVVTSELFDIDASLIDSFMYTPEYDAYVSQFDSEVDFIGNFLMDSVNGLVELWKDVPNEIWGDNSKYESSLNQSINTYVSKDSSRRKQQIEKNKQNLWNNSYVTVTEIEHHTHQKSTTSIFEPDPIVYGVEGDAHVVVTWGKDINDLDVRYYDE